jgi:hypothetical protein
MQMVWHEAVGKIRNIALPRCTQERLLEGDMLRARKQCSPLVGAQGEEVPVAADIVETIQVLGIGMHVEVTRNARAVRDDVAEVFRLKPEATVIGDRSDSSG